jgi:NADH-quinone oxidoreductase subunit N
MPVSWFAYFPHLSLAVGGLLVFGAAMFRPAPPWWVAPGLAGLGVAPLLVWVVLPGPADGLVRFFAGLLGLVALATLGLTARYARERHFADHALYGLLPWSALGMLLLAGARDWLMLALGLELASLGLYAMVAARLRDPLGAEAALKYFLPGAMALATLLFGISLIYAGGGSLDMAASLEAGGPLVAVGLGLVLVGLAFKLSLAPVHLWTPDVYQGAPAPVAAFLSTGSKAAMAAALLRLAADVPPETRAMLWPGLAIVAGLTMAVGNIGAIAQTRLKRLLAYSAIAQMGYVAMAALAVADGGREAALFSLAAYALMDLGAFGAVGAVSGLAADRDALVSYRGLGYACPWRAGVLTVSLFSLAGLPPTVGFFAKFLVFGAALRGGYLALAVLGVLMAAVGVFYCLRVVAALYLRPGIEAHPEPPAATGPVAGLVLALLTGLMLGLGIFPGPLLSAITRLAGAAP